MIMVEWKKLGEVCNFQNGFAFKSNLFKSEGLPIVRITNITSTDVDMSDCKYFDIGDYCKINLIPFQIKRDDILLAMSGATTGKIGKYKGDKTAYLNQRVGKFIPQASVLNNGFLYHFLLNKTNELYIMAGGGAQPNLSSNKLMGELSIPLPSLSEQERIVGILDTFTSSKENLKAQISLRRKQYEHYRDKLLDLEGKPGVEMKTLGEIARYRRGSFPQPYGNKEWYDGEGAMPFVQVADVEEFGRKLKDKTKQFISTLAMPKSVYVPKGTVIVTLQGSIGKVAITQYDAYIDRTLGIFEGYIIDINKIYFALQLEKIFSIKREKARGGTIKTITKEEFTNFAIPLPSLQEQSRIVSILDEFEASIKNLEAQLKEREKQYEYYRNKLLTFE